VGGGVPAQIQPSPGLPERQAANRRRARVLEMMHTLPLPAQKAIQDLLDQEDQEKQEAQAASGNHANSSDQSSAQRSAQPSPTGRG
jgi:phospholipid/cholesterol/gamma-HCH transport system ATP-binding protein